jgi:hypothetical protein
MSSLALEGFRDRVPDIPNPSLARYYEIIEVGWDGEGGGAGWGGGRRAGTRTWLESRGRADGERPTHHHANGPNSGPSHPPNPRAQQLALTPGDVGAAAGDPPRDDTLPDGALVDGPAAAAAAAALSDAVYGPGGAGAAGTKAAGVKRKAEVGLPGLAAGPDARGWGGAAGVAPGRGAAPAGGCSYPDDHLSAPANASPRPPPPPPPSSPPPPARAPHRGAVRGDRLGLPRGQRQAGAPHQRPAQGGAPGGGGFGLWRAGARRRAGAAGAGAEENRRAVQNSPAPGP